MKWSPSKRSLGQTSEYVSSLLIYQIPAPTLSNPSINLFHHNNCTHHTSTVLGTIHYLARIYQWFTLVWAVPERLWWLSDCRHACLCRRSSTIYCSTESRTVTHHPTEPKWRPADGNYSVNRIYVLFFGGNLSQADRASLGWIQRGTARSGDNVFYKRTDWCLLTHHTCAFM